MLRLLPNVECTRVTQARRCHVGSTVPAATYATVSPDGRRFAVHSFTEYQLSVGPFPPGSRGLVGGDNVFRIRVGVYRVLYSVINAQLIDIILKVGHRKDIHR